jgi:hypothetical protein
MATNLNIVLSSAILQVVQNTDSSQRVNSPVSVTLPGAEASYFEYLQIAAGGGSVIPLPAVTIWVACVMNLGGVNGSPAGNLTVQYQAVGGALNSAANSRVIVPLGIDWYFNPTEGAGGIQALTLVASVANTPARILLAF